MARYLAQLDTADLQDPSETITLTKTRLKEKLAKLDEAMKRPGGDRETDARLALFGRSR